VRGQALAFWVREPGAGEIRPVRLPEPGARGFREGDFPGPVPYDYLSVGVVKHGPPLLRGRAVFSLYPHQTASVVPARAVVPAPDDAEAVCAWPGDADLRRQLRHVAEERHVTRSGWSATADQIPRVIAEAV
jgi:hypothetical protein